MNFPKIKTIRTNLEQLQKIKDEILEFEEEFSDEEAVDILHTAETFVRVHFKGREETLKKLIEKVISKNTARGYYEKNCY